MPRRKHLILWDGGSAETNEEVHTKMVSFGAVLKATSDAFVHNGLAACGSWLFYNVDKLREEDLTYLKLSGEFLEFCPLIHWSCDKKQVKV